MILPLFVVVALSQTRRKTRSCQVQVSIEILPSAAFLLQKKFKLSSLACFGSSSPTHRIKQNTADPPLFGTANVPFHPYCSLWGNIKSEKNNFIAKGQNSNTLAFGRFSLKGLPYPTPPINCSQGPAQNGPNAWREKNRYLLVNIKKLSVWAYSAKPLK